MTKVNPKEAPRGFKAVKMPSNGVECRLCSYKDRKVCPDSSKGIPSVSCYGYLRVDGQDVNL